jgi:hypothetical protein
MKVAQVERGMCMRCGVVPRPAGRQFCDACREAIIGGKPFATSHGPARLRLPKPAEPAPAPPPRRQPSIPRQPEAFTGLFSEEEVTHFRAWLAEIRVKVEDHYVVIGKEQRDE